MSASENFGPDSAVDILRSKGIDIGETSRAKESRTPQENFSASQNFKENARPPAKEDKIQPPTDESSRLPWIIAGVLLSGILALLLKVFKGKSTS